MKFYISIRPRDQHFQSRYRIFPIPQKAAMYPTKVVIILTSWKISLACIWTSYKWNHKGSLKSVQLLLLNSTSMRFIPIAACMKISFFLMAAIFYYISMPQRTYPFDCWYSWIISSSGLLWIINILLLHTVNFCGGQVYPLLLGILHKKSHYIWLY